MDTSIRVATFNASLNRGTEGALIDDLSTPDNAQAKTVAEIIQRAAPDVVLINEFDFDAAGPNGSSLAAELFRQNYLAVSQNGAASADYPYVYIAPSNTGVASGFDLNNNGTAVTTPGAPGYGDDSLGFGAFPGQFGMVIFSKYPIEADGVRTFQNFLWKDMPGARLPDDASTPQPQDWYSPEELAVLPLSSKSHWDVPINVNGEIVHVLAAHPTPPVFDGPEDRNGLRNADEIRFWDDYVTPGQGGYIYDDQGGTGGLAPGERFVIVGDYNADPNDGDSVDKAIQQILSNPSVDASVVPTSPGGVQQSSLQGGVNATHTGDPAQDTADFADTTPGNLRADYVLPSQVGLDPIGGSVFWPLDTDPTFPLVGTFDPAFPGGFPSSDHRLVLMDLDVVDDQRRDVTGIEFLGEATFQTGLTFEGTEVGGLSGITYDPGRGHFYAVSDDRSQLDPARFYTIDIDLGDGNLAPGDVAFTGVTTLLDANGQPFPALSLDPEGIALTDAGVFISSEGDASRLVAPFVNLFSLQGQQLDALPVDAKFLPTADQSAGIRNNLAFESLAVTPDKSTLYTATENALFQDGPAAGLESGSASRIVAYDLATGQPTAEYIYVTDPVDAQPDPAGSFVTNGLVDLLAIDNDGTLLAIERSFSTGVGNSIRIYKVLTQGATDVSGVDAIETEVEDGELAVNLDQPVQKELLFDLADLGLPLDNVEGISFGPKLADGRQSIVLVSDNNFSGTQFTQFLAFAIDLEDIPTIEAVVETPAETRFADLARACRGPGSGRRGDLAQSLRPGRERRRHVAQERRTARLRPCRPGIAVDRAEGRPLQQCRRALQRRARPPQIQGSVRRLGSCQRHPGDLRHRSRYPEAQGRHVGEDARQHLRRRRRRSHRLWPRRVHGGRRHPLRVRHSGRWRQDRPIEARRGGRQGVGRACADIDAAQSRGPRSRGPPVGGHRHRRYDRLRLRLGGKRRHLALQHRSRERSGLRRVRGARCRFPDAGSRGIVDPLRR